MGEKRANYDVGTKGDAGIPLLAVQKTTETPLSQDGKYTQLQTDAYGGLRVAAHFDNSASLDSFSRVRVSNPSFVFDAQLTYDLQPLLFEAVTAESGATVAHDATNRMALMTFSSTGNGGKAFMQSYEHFRYQAGRSQLIFLTFNFIETKANTIKFVGYSDGSNGIELQQSGSTVNLVLLSDTDKNDETVAKADWNLDKLDGTGPSGLTLNLAKTQILVIDLQALYVGRVRVGFDLGGNVVYCHQFTHANSQTKPYFQTANLPVRCGMTCSGTASTTMNFICCSVITEGGEPEVGGYNFAQEGNVVAANGARTHVLSIRPKTTFNSIANRTKVVIESIDVMTVGASPVIWEAVLGQSVSGASAFSDVNATYSGVEYNNTGADTGNPAIVIARGYSAATNTSKSSTSYRLSNRYPLSLDVTGGSRALGTLSILLSGVGGVSSARASISWRELR